MFSEMHYRFTIFLVLIVRAALLFWYRKVTCRGSEETWVSTGLLYNSLAYFLAFIFSETIGVFHVLYVRILKIEISKSVVYFVVQEYSIYNAHKHPLPPTYTQIHGPNIYKDTKLWMSAFLKN
jgi:hypothetical protein